MDGEIKINELVTVTPDGELTYDGYKIPNVRMTEQTEDEAPEGEFREVGWYLILDDRFAITVPRTSELGRWAPILANAMAVAAGFTSHGPNSVVRNPHGPSVVSAPHLA